MIVLSLQHATEESPSGYRPYQETQVLVPAAVCDMFTLACEWWPVGSEVTIDYGVPGGPLMGVVVAVAWRPG